jgi:hypothetical protein
MVLVQGPAPGPLYHLTVLPVQLPRCYGGMAACCNSRRWDRWWICSTGQGCRCSWPPTQATAPGGTRERGSGSKVCAACTSSPVTHPYPDTSRQSTPCDKHPTWHYPIPIMFAYSIACMIPPSLVTWLPGLSLVPCPLRPRYGGPFKAPTAPPPSTRCYKQPPLTDARCVSSIGFVQKVRHWSHLSTWQFC